MSGYLGMSVGVLEDGSPQFSRRTLVIDRTGTIRYARDGSPDYEEILLVLKQLEEEGGS